MEIDAVARDVVVADLVSATAASLARTDCDLGMDAIAFVDGANEVTFHVPLGEDFTYPVLVGLDRLADGRTSQSEAGDAVASAIASAASTRTETLRRLLKLRSQAECLVGVNRRRGADIAVAGLRIDPIASALVRRAPATINLYLLLLGHDLSKGVEAFPVYYLNDVHEVFREVLPDQMARMERLIEARTGGAIGMVDPVVPAALAAFGLPAGWLGHWALHEGDPKHPGPPPAGLVLQWDNGVILATMDLAPRPHVRWCRDRLELLGCPLPETVRCALVERPFTDLIGHPALAGLTIGAVEEHDDDDFTYVTPVAGPPLLLLADGSVHASTSRGNHDSSAAS